MHHKPTRWVAGAALAAAMAMSPAMAQALDVRIDASGYALIAVPEVGQAEQLWIDVEEPTLGADDVIVSLDGVPVTLRATAFGVGAALPHEGAAASLKVGLRRQADPDVAVTVVDADGRILFSDVERLSLSPVTDEPEPTPTPSPSTSPTPTATASPSPTPTATATPTGTPTASPTRGSSAPTSPPPPTSKPRPRPGLPSTGGEASLLSAAVLAALAAGVAVALRRRGGSR